MQVRFKPGTTQLLHTPDCLKDFEDMLEGMGVELKSLYKRIEELRKENMQLQSENYKDEELSKMQKQLNEARHSMYRGFPISEEELDAANSWSSEHEEKYHKGRSTGACGGGYIYLFEPTGLGTFGSICCELCRRKAIQDSRGNIVKYNKLLKEYDAEFTFQEAF